MATLKMVSPWVNYYHEMNAFFKKDRYVTVVYDEEETEIKLYVEGAEKADALTKLIPMSREFGNVTLKITVVPANCEPANYEMPYRRPRYSVRTPANETEVLFNIAFRGNPAFSFIDRVSLQTNDIIYVVFRNEVVQYYNDDIGDYFGQCSTLYQNIAADIFKPIDSVHYCTDKPYYERED